MAYQQSGTEASRASDVADPVALTSAVAVAAPTKAEYDALRADVVALRGTVAALVTSLRDSNIIG